MTQPGDYQFDSVLATDEVIHAEAEARDAKLLVTDRRVVVAEEGRTALRCQSRSSGASSSTSRGRGRRRW